jgi:hypothetical protein
MANYLEELGGVLQTDTMANFFEYLSGMLHSFGAAGIVLLVVPILITLLARDVPRALYTILLSLASFMLLVACASAVSALAILSGLGSFVVALESILARRRMVALDKQIVDLSSRLNQLEAAEQRRLMLEVSGWTKKGRRRRQARPSSEPTNPEPVGHSSPSRSQSAAFWLPATAAPGAG